MNHLKTLYDADKRLNLALDFDDTYTAAPDLWSLFIELAKAQGHTVRIVTYRPANGYNSDIDAVCMQHGIPAIYTAGEQKSTFCANIGYNVDVWIDDMPEAIPSIDTMKAMTTFN